MKMKFSVGADPHQTSIGWWRTFVAGILAVLVLGFAVAVEGKKPVKPPPEPPPVIEDGYIYCTFWESNPTSEWVCQMNSDGTNVRYLFEMFSDSHIYSGGCSERT